MLGNVVVALAILSPAGMLAELSAGLSVSIGTAGVFSAIAARAQSGHSRAVRSRSAANGLVAPVPNSPGTSRTSPGAGSDTPTALTPPPTAPSPGYQYDPAPVVSGAT